MYYLVFRIFRSAGKPAEIQTSFIILGTRRPQGHQTSICSITLRRVCCGYQGDTVRVIWATHDTDPTLDGGELVGLNWHGKEHRGVRSLHLLTPPVKNGVPRELRARHWDVTLQNVSVDTQ